MTSRLLLIALLLPLTAAADQEGAARLRYTPPTGWQRTIHAETGLAVLTPPGGHASVTLMQSTEFTGAPEDWHRELWSQIESEDMKPRMPSTPGRRGEFLTTWTAFTKSDGTEAWIAICSIVRNGRDEGLLFFADGEGPLC